MKKLLLFLFSCSLGFSQDLPEIVYPSPTASALGEYGNTPVSLSNGTPSINIPIWEIKGRKLSVPISLSYRASGIKVEEHGSYVGLGWTLNAGGMITRIVKDKEDREVNQNGMIPYRAAWPLSDFKDHTPYDFLNELNNTFNFYDKEPDNFYYNFLNYSGKYIFDDAGNPLIAPDIGFKIEIPVAGSERKIIDTNGVIHTFGLFERDSNSGYVTGWYLTKIESADLSEWIDFEYTSEVNRYFVNKREARLVAYNTISTYLSEPWYRIETNLSYRVSKITTSFGETIDFLPGQNRQDLVIYSGDNDSSKAKTIGGIEISYENKCIKKIELDHDFIEVQNSGYIDSYWTNTLNEDVTWATKRLYLKSIRETTCSDENVKKYSFEYYGRNSQNKDLLPSKLSFAQDHWGYFNGKTSNTSYRPSFSGYVPAPDLAETLHYQTLSGADRTPSFPHMEYGTLKSITYPTGGKTDFVFEQHQNISTPSYFPNQSGGYDSNAGGLRIREVNDKIDENTVKSKRYSYFGGLYADYPNYGADDLVYRTEIDNGNYEDVLHHLIHPTFLAGGGGPGNETSTADRRKFLKIGSGHPSGLGTTNGYHLSYDRIVEKEAGNGSISRSYTSSNIFGGDQLNRTIYISRLGADIVENIITSSSYTANTFQWPYSVRTARDWVRGFPLSEGYYSENGELIKSVSYNYNFVELKGVKRKLRLNSSNELEHYFDYESPMYGLKTEKTSFDDEESSPSGNCGFCIDTNEQVWYYNEYKVGHGVALLNKETTVENGVTTVKEYTFNTQNQIATTTVTDSKGQSIVSENKYPQDLAASNNVYVNMVDKNIIAPVIEQSTSIDNDLLSKLKNNYKDWGNNIFEPELVQTFKGGNSIENRVEFINYYDNSNLKEVSRTDGVHVVYIWGYQEKYPIAKIEHANFNDIPTSLYADIVSKSNLDDDRCLDSGNCDEKTLRNYLNRLRNTTYAPDLDDAMITTYTFDPLIGVTSITDPKGYTIYYDYDDFNRLRQIKDENGKIISQNEYHYESQTN